MVLMADPLAASGVTRREAEVLAGLGEQLSNAEIGGIVKSCGWIPFVDHAAT